MQALLAAPSHFVSVVPARHDVGHACVCAERAACAQLHASAMVRANCTGAAGASTRSSSSGCSHTSAAWRQRGCCCGAAVPRGMTRVKSRWQPCRTAALAAGTCGLTSSAAPCQHTTVVRGAACSRVAFELTHALRLPGTTEAKLMQLVKEPCLSACEGCAVHGCQGIADSAQHPLSSILIALPLQQAGPGRVKAVDVWRKVDVACHLRRGSSMSSCCLTQPAGACC